MSGDKLEDVTVLPNVRERIANHIRGLCIIYRHQQLDAQVKKKERRGVAGEGMAENTLSRCSGAQDVPMKELRSVS